MDHEFRKDTVVMTLLHSLTSGISAGGHGNLQNLWEARSSKVERPASEMASSCMYMEPYIWNLGRDETGLPTRTPMCGLANTEITWIF